LLHLKKVINYFTLLLEKVICYCSRITCNMLLPNTADKPLFDAILAKPNQIPYQVYPDFWCTKQTVNRKLYTTLSVLHHK